MLNLWDCGGQDSFYESYFNHQQDYIFRSVEVSVACRRCLSKSESFASPVVWFCCRVFSHRRAQQ